MIMNHGHYEVDGEIFTNKILALRAGTEKNCQVFWKWHPEYDRICWHEPSPYSLDEIYRIRAQQLRDRYDHLTLSFSGGSDSFNVLNSFIKNNIHLDEVFVRWPRRATEKLYVPNAQDTSTKNILSEWDYTIHPILKYLEKYHPAIRITVEDVSDLIVDRTFTDNDLIHVAENINPGVWGKFNAISQTELALTDKGRQTCLIMGLEKPHICKIDNKIFCYFIDFGANNHPRFGDGRNIELFYWTPDLPEVTWTQARHLYDYIVANPECHKFLGFGHKNFDRSQRNVWDNITKRIIYPCYDPKWFQSDKENNRIFSQVDQWLFKNADPKFLQSWKFVIDNLLSSIDDSFKNFSSDGDPQGWGGFISEMYYLGESGPVKS
jgi:hypothetical protein